MSVPGCVSVWICVTRMPVCLLRVHLSLPLCVCVCVSVSTTPCRQEPGSGPALRSTPSLPPRLSTQRPPSPPNRRFLGLIELHCPAPAPPDQLPHLKAMGGRSCPRSTSGNAGTERGPECPAPKRAPIHPPRASLGLLAPSRERFVRKTQGDISHTAATPFFFLLGLPVSEGLFWRAI